MTSNRLSIYGESFQHFLIKAIVEDPSFFRSIREHLTPSLVPSEHVSKIYETICNFYERYNFVPSYEELEGELRKKLLNSRGELDLCLRTVYQIQFENLKNPTYVKDKTIEFCRYQAFEKAVKDSVERLEDLRDNPEKPAEFNEQIKNFSDVEMITLDKIDSDIIEHMDEFYNTPSRSGQVATGWKLYDFLLDGGPADTEVHTIAAYTGVGKTTGCINIGAEAFIRGKKVLHYTFENPQRYIAHRYHSRLTRIQTKNLYFRRDEVKIRLDKIKANGGFLHVKEYPMTRHSVTSLEAYYAKLLDQGIEPDIIIIDSPMHLKPTTRMNSERENTSIVWKDVKSFMQVVKKPCIVTAQLNREAWGQDAAGTQNVASSLDIARDSDSFTTIMRTKDDRLAGQARFNVSKSRFGEDEIIFPMRWHGPIGLIEDDKEAIEKKLDELRIAETAYNSKDDDTEY